MHDAIVGICRFSFLGKSDWVGTRAADGDAPEILAARCLVLYADERLRRRFLAFETMCLPSIRAQSDPDFSFWLLTSPELPAPWLARLRDLCADVPQIRIIQSPLRNPVEALRPHLREAARAAGRPVIQFRLDDDDAISRDHIARIRRNAARFADLPAFALSWPDGLIFGSLDGAEVKYFRVLQPFSSAGTALRMARPGGCIYAHGHFQLPRLVSSFTALDGLGFVQTRWELGDTSGVTPRSRPGWNEISRLEFDGMLGADFPFLKAADLGFAETKGAA